MTLYPKIQLSRLREIGWKFWDPIGLAHNGSSPDEGCADEYDRYLLHVVSTISRGGSKGEATAYLTGIASEHMGMSVVDADAAAATAQAIADYLISLPDGPKTVR
ncbi:MULTISPECIES: hypothetical protein [Sphingomonadaceae]|jgi:hypothetical protein|uniref:hypothetical protein n=1 Tax=Sphingomonadales TaxID=204457 RepID=UPI0012BB2494|nr:MULTISPECIES: hypothetical protein [Sphingomonadaceae]QGP77789.1 hypothetical protein GL174_01340 [Sphingobium sp. CAP-1]QGP80435.1 hypothetical protein GL174_14945 [Sphingobium sp. CAP-1]